MRNRTIEDATSLDGKNKTGGAEDLITYVQSYYCLNNQQLEDNAFF